MFILLCPPNHTIMTTIDLALSQSRGKSHHAGLAEASTVDLPHWQKVEHPSKTPRLAEIIVMRPDSLSSTRMSQATTRVCDTTT